MVEVRGVPRNSTQVPGPPESGGRALRPGGGGGGGRGAGGGARGRECPPRAARPRAGASSGRSEASERGRGVPPPGESWCSATTSWVIGNNLLPCARLVIALRIVIALRMVIALRNGLLRSRREGPNFSHRGSKTSVAVRGGVQLGVLAASSEKNAPGRAPPQVGLFWALSCEGPHLRQICGVVAPEHRDGLRRPPLWGAAAGPGRAPTGGGRQPGGSPPRAARRVGVGAAHTSSVHHSCAVKDRRPGEDSEHRRWRGRSPRTERRPAYRGRRRGTPTCDRGCPSSPSRCQGRELMDARAAGKRAGASKRRAKLG